MTSYASLSLCAGARTNSFVHSSLPDGGELSLELCSQRTRTVKRKQNGFTGGANELAGLYKNRVGEVGETKKKLARTFLSGLRSANSEGTSNLERKFSLRLSLRTHVFCTTSYASLSLCAGARTNSFVHSSLPDGGELSLELCSQRTRTVKRKQNGFTGGAN